MIIAALVILGLALGSFANALVWRLHEQSKKGQKQDAALSISKGRSMCPNCRHALSAHDLVPLFSWLALGGKCRYCGKPISKQYPLLELTTAILLVVSYAGWPVNIEGAQLLLFGLWALMLTALLALLIYDLRWYLLPDRILRPLAVVSSLYAVITVTIAENPVSAALNVLFSVLVGGGLFYVLFQASKGKWIGGGDVKLGWVLGLILGTPGRSLLMIFLASLLGSFVSIPLLAMHKVKRSSVVPFGPFLIAAAIIVHLYGHEILNWYQRSFFPYTL